MRRFVLIVVALAVYCIAGAPFASTIANAETKKIIIKRGGGDRGEHRGRGRGRGGKKVVIIKKRGRGRGD